MAAPLVIVRPAAPQDVDHVVESYGWLFEPPGRRPTNWNEERAGDLVRRVIESPRAAILVAESDQELVGIVSVYLDIESVRFGLRAWVEDLAVHPRHRSKGIGKSLLDEAKRWARLKGAAYVELESGERRVDAHRFYDRENPDRRSKSFGWEL